MFITLRALEPEDLDFLLKIENNQLFWSVSGTTLPFSKYFLTKYLDESHLDIYTTKQFRFVIENKSTKNAVGLIDLYDLDPKNKRVGVGIVISEEEQGKGYAIEAIKLIKKHVKDHLMLHQIYAKIHKSNIKSLKLFENSGFIQSAILKDWYFDGKNYVDEIVMQNIINY